jgi:hypothetical protein
MRPNTVLLGWPTKNEDDSLEKCENFVDLLKVSFLNQKAVLVLKSNNVLKTPQSGIIDVWMIMNEGGLMIKLAYLLNLGPIWKQCSLRVFTIAHEHENSVKIKKDLERCMELLRIDAHVKVIEMQNAQITAFAYEKTLRIMERKAILRELKLPQTILEVKLIYK